MSNKPMKKLSKKKGTRRKFHFNDSKHKYFQL